MSIVDRVAKVFSDVFAIDAGLVTIDTVPDDVEKWDSMGHMNMVGELEKEFGVQFDLDEIMGMESVQLIGETLKNKGVSD